ncbi:MAG: FAD/NAD(P)-binding oxidoreductase [Sulfolobaceae archaeon]|nr:FAD/NAD(P)-binding oxidoreductase [Sulfolobaceae archaeon]
MKNILILGGGFGGLAVANELREALKGEVNITVVDKKQRTEYRPSYLYVMIGYREPEQMTAPLEYLENRGIKYINAEVTKIDAANRTVETTAGKLNYDYLIIALGAETHPEMIKGGPFPSAWELDLALKAREALKSLRKGKVVIAAYDKVYRCPPAPWEAAFLIDYHYSGLGIRKDIEITMVHPYKRPFENYGPLAAKAMERMMQQRNVNWMGLNKDVAIDYVDTQNKILYTTTGEKVPYDVLITVPPHLPPKPVAESDIADQKGWAAVNPPTMRTVKYDDVYAIGDVVAPHLGIGMAGVIAHSYVKYVVNAISSDIKGTYKSSDFRVYATCAFDAGGIGMTGACDFTPQILKTAPLPDCVILPPSSTITIFKEYFEKQYFSWLLGYVPGWSE